MSKSYEIQEGDDSVSNQNGDRAIAGRSGSGIQIVKRPPTNDPLLTVEQVSERLNVSKDWVWDHSSRKSPLLPVIRMGDGTLRYRASKIEEFINERERLSYLRRKRG